MIIVKYYEPNKFVKIIDKLHICGCGRPDHTYGLIHQVMKEISENGVETEATPYYDFMIYQLNHMGFLEHGTIIYGSWITKEGKELMQALEEMKKFDYDYQDFYNANLEEVERDD